MRVLIPQDHAHSAFWHPTHFHQHVAKKVRAVSALAQEIVIREAVHGDLPALADIENGPGGQWTQQQIVVSGQATHPWRARLCSSPLPPCAPGPPEGHAMLPCAGGARA